jgi:hypothetical protein
MRKLHSLTWAILLAAVMAMPAVAAETETHKRYPSPEGANVYIISPKNGEIVDSKFKVVFGLQGMGVCPAGLTAAGGQPLPDTGHHHLLVDVEKMPPKDIPLPSDQPENIIHFGGGQTETTLELEPGKHTLQLVLGDFAHVPHDPPVISEKITITVKE